MGMFEIDEYVKGPTWIVSEKEWSDYNKQLCE